MSVLQETQREVERVVAGVDGSIGVAAWPLGDESRGIRVNADVLYPTASVLKTPLLYSLYRLVDEGNVDLDRRIEIKPEHLTPGSGVLQHLKVGLQPTIYDVAVLMMIVSDNQATDILHNMVGPDRIHADMKELGLERIQVPLNCRRLLYGMVGMDVDNPEHTYEMFRQKARAKEYDKSTVVWSDEEGSGNNLTPPDQMAKLCEYIDQGVGLSP
ncbi:MAG: serine hydrolase, partial [Chloroflexota bacterium]